MLKAEIREEVIVTNEKISHYLFTDGRLIDYMIELLEDMLYDEYKMGYEARHEAVCEGLKTADYVQILRNIADRMENNNYVL